MNQLYKGDMKLLSKAEIKKARWKDGRLFDPFLMIRSLEKLRPPKLYLLGKNTTALLNALNAMDMIHMPRDILKAIS